MFLEVALADIMVKVAPKIYRKYVIMVSKGKLLLYVQIQKVFHGLLVSALMFYRKLVNYIEAYGFQIKPYNPCGANKIKTKNI